jgi:hypothetical protein
LIARILYRFDLIPHPAWMQIQGCAPGQVGIPEDVVQQYIRSVTFNDAMKFYKALL